MKTVPVFSTEPSSRPTNATCLSIAAKVKRTTTLTRSAARSSSSLGTPNTLTSFFRRSWLSRLYAALISAVIWWRRSKTMSKTIPWGVHRLGNMISSQVRTQRSGIWVRAVPIPYRANSIERVRAAWWVFLGRAEAVVWPDAGELEHAMSGGFEAGSSVAE
ncbi:hypothetical protein AGR5A_Cc10025 [Agrobacterium genomosp. 5 str. CFBP 6626]|nr:hypothetical protein AGR5A_Cc10025 [Agrobacterium genomosp. 5 str. CFBP 6626]